MLSTPEELRKHSLKLSAKIIESYSVFPRRFIYIYDCLQFFPSLEDVMTKVGMDSKSFWHSVDHHHGVIWDPTASVIFTNCEGIVLNEPTLIGIKSRDN